MLKRIRWSGWIVILVLTFALVATIAKGSQALMNHTDKEQELTNDLKVEETTMSKYPGLDLKTKTEETSKYTLSMNIPTTDNESINATIHEWIKKEKKEFLTAVEENETHFDKDYRAHLNIQLETEKIKADLYNLVFYVYQYAGGANGINTIKTFTIDMKEQKLLTLSDIIELDDEGLEMIQNYIKNDLVSNEEINIYLMDDLLDKVLNDINNWEWSINKKILTVYFNEYEIAAGAAGNIEVEIPIQQIKAYLNEDISSQLELELSEDSTEESEKEEKKEKEEQETLLDPDGKYVALTFDDGPSATVTPRILETLKEYNALATFFMLGSQVEYYPDIAKKVADAGHEIANHTDNHIDLTVVSKEKVHQEIKDSADKILKASGQYPKTVRPPYGAYNDTVIHVAKECEQSIILWSIDSLDWQSRNADAVSQVVLRDVVPGGIVLMHDIHESTADALPELLQSLKEQGYEFITVSQLLKLQKSDGIGPHYGTLNY